MYRTELVEGITVENVIEKINAKIEETVSYTHLDVYKRQA